MQITGIIQIFQEQLQKLLGYIIINNFDAMCFPQ